MKKIGKNIDEFSKKFWGNTETLVEKNQSILFLAVIFILGIGIRWFFMPYYSGDYIECLLPWTNAIVEQGGIASMGNLVGNYTPPYMLLMSIISYIPIDYVFTIKAVNILGDISLAMACYFLIKNLTGSPLKARIGAAMVFILPTVILNSSAWGQCDAIYTSFLVWFIYFTFSKKLYWAGAFFGMAFAFKLQTIFLIPFLVLLIVIGRIKLRHLLPGFLAYFILFLPSIVMGEGISVLWDVYLLQGSDNPDKLTMNVGNLYSWLSSGEGNNIAFTPGYVLFGVSAIGILLYWLWINRKYFNNHSLLNAALLFAIVCPYVLPKMHDRYFFIADILSIVFVFMNIKKWYVPTIIQLLSIASYIPFLFAKPFINFDIVAPIYIIPIAAVAFCLYTHFSECKKQEDIISKVTAN